MKKDYIKDCGGISECGIPKEIQEKVERQNQITEIVFILDKSGSMEGMEQDTIGGFNAMIEKQRGVPGKVYISTVLFSNYSEVLHDRKTLDEIEPLTLEDYEVGGCTALFDAIGGAIKHISNIHKYARKEDVPSRTMFVITTDGLENASREYSNTQIKNMIKKQEERGWEFLFLADNIDAALTADSIGIKRERAVNYSVKKNTKGMFEEVGKVLCCLRCDEPIDFESIEENIKKKK